MLQFSGQMPQKCSNDAKMSPKDSRIMYKSQAYNPLIRGTDFLLERWRFEKLCLPLKKSGFAPDYGVSIC